MKLPHGSSQITTGRDHTGAASSIRMSATIAEGPVSQGTMATVVVCSGSKCPGRPTAPLVQARYPNGVWIENAATGGPLLIPVNVSLTESIWYGLYLRTLLPLVRHTMMVKTFKPGGDLGSRDARQSSYHISSSTCICATRSGRSVGLRADL